jgi:peptidoglycan/xylan/chitin deacetylase (PgdA/CDA1 family)
MDKSMKELVLLFHGIGEPHHLVGPEELPYWLSAASFSHLLDQVSECSDRSDLGITITFDDGNASDAYLALPELSKRGLRASFFVCAGRIGKSHYLDNTMIKDLLEGGMSVGCHGMDHRDWRTLDSLTLELEVDGARRKLEQVVQRPVTTVAVPFGSYDRRILNRLTRDRWECIYTSDRGTAQSLAMIKPRETIDATMQDEHLIRRLSANPALPLRLKRGLSRFYKRLR